MQQIEVIPLNRLRLNRGHLLRKITACQTRQEKTRFPVVFRRVDDLEIDSGPALFSSRNHAQIVLGTLVGPAAFLVAVLLVGKPHVDHAGEVQGGTPIRLHQNREIQCGAAEFTTGRSAEKPQGVGISLEGAVILQNNLKLSPERDPAVKGWNHHLTFHLGAADHVRCALFVFQRQNHFFAVDQKFTAAEFFNRHRGAQSDLGEFSSLGEPDFGTVFPLRGRFLLQHDRQSRLRKIRHLENSVHPVVRGLAGSVLNLKIF